MEEITFMSQTLSLLVLLLISSLSYILSKKINFPYTVLLVIIWIVLIPISNFSIFSFLDDFSLTPNLLFYVFLPVLLFEAAYNIKYKQLISNWKSISLLAIFWLLISSFIIAWLMFFIFPFVWINIPFLVCLLFGALISATDPVAVLAIFKTLWAPRRLTIIFEWESLFNDWTAVAFFTVVLWIILTWWAFDSLTILEWIWKFSSMLFGWILFWLLTWIIFSNIIWKIKNNEEVEIVLTMLLAHFTFILSELITHEFHSFPISWVVSTVVASIVIWNYWRYKITPRVEEHMQKFWEFFAFISNSVIFILVWLTVSRIESSFSDFIIPIILIIVFVAFARTISVYLPLFLLNKTKLEEKIPVSWMHLLSWWSLRWAISLMMILMIPEAWILEFQKNIGWEYSYSIRELLLILSIWCIFFTLFVKAITTPIVMKKLWVDKLHNLEKFEYEEWRILANLKILQKLNLSFKKSYLTEIEYEELKWKYSKRLNNAVFRMKNLLWEWEKSEDLIKKAISLHSLWIEKQYLKELFYYNEIDEKNFKYILRRIEKQIERLESWKEQFSSFCHSTIDYDFFTKILVNRYLKEATYIDAYIRNRARVIVTRKVIKELKYLKEIEFWFEKNVFDETIELYERFYKEADRKRMEIFDDHKATINALESRLVNKSLLKLEEKTIDDLYNKEIITPKLYIKFKNEIEEEMFADVRTMI